MSDKEIQQFEAELLQSVRQMKKREFARLTKVSVTEVAKARSAALQEFATSSVGKIGRFGRAFPDIKILAHALHFLLRKFGRNFARK